MSLFTSAVESAKSLSDLLEVLNSDLSTGSMQDEECMAELPTFGGEEPASTVGVWSWDATRMIVGDAAPFEIVARKS